MYLRRSLMVRAIFIVLWALGVWVQPVRAADEPSAVMLVATPEMTDPVYGATVLVARPFGNDQYIGFIVNKPTTVTLAEAFPEHIPSRKVVDPIFLGGPDQVNAVFALVQSKTSPGEGSMQLAPDLYIVIAGDTVDQVIEHEPEHARFLFGAVVWQPGELEAEIKRGAWYVDQPETNLMMRKETGSLWKELVQKLKVRRNAI